MSDIKTEASSTETSELPAENWVQLREVLAYQLFVASSWADQEPRPDDEDDASPTQDLAWRNMGVEDLREWRDRATQLYKTLAESGISIRISKLKLLEKEIKRIMTVPERLAYTLPST